MTRTEHSLRNIQFSLLGQGVGILTAFFVRKVFVLTLSQEYLGLDGAFSNILTMLSLAELGIGGAVTFGLYKPLAENDQEQIAALMTFYGKAYRRVGLAVAALGGALAPFLPALIRDLPDIPHIYAIYLLFLLNAASSYFFVYEQSLIIASQRQYIVTVCHSALKILFLLAQALFLWLTHNYFVYLGLKIGAALLENLILSYLANRLYPYLKTMKKASLSWETQRKLLQNTRALLAHKIGTVVVLGTDNLLISCFVGVVPVGLYSNYLMVLNGLNTGYHHIFRALTASVGNLGATEEAGRALPVFQRVCFACNWLYGFSAVCLTVLLNPFVELWLGEEFLFSQGTVCLISLNFYVSGMRQAVLTFRDAYGLYWYDRRKPLIESAVNLAVSAALAVPFGMAGIFWGTFASTMTTCFWIEPLVLFRYGLQTSAKPYFRDYAVNTVITLLCAALTWRLCQALPGTGMPHFLGKMAVCGIVGNLFYGLAYRRREEFRYFLRLLAGLLAKEGRRETKRKSRHSDGTSHGGENTGK